MVRAFLRIVDLARAREIRVQQVRNYEAGGLILSVALVLIDECHAELARRSWIVWRRCPLSTGIFMYIGRSCVPYEGRAEAFCRLARSVRCG